MCGFSFRLLFFALLGLSFGLPASAHGGPTSLGEVGGVTAEVMGVIKCNELFGGVATATESEALAFQAIETAFRQLFETLSPNEQEYVSESIFGNHLERYLSDLEVVVYYTILQENMLSRNGFGLRAWKSGNPKLIGALRRYASTQILVYKKQGGEVATQFLTRFNDELVLQINGATNSR